MRRATSPQVLCRLAQREFYRHLQFEQLDDRCLLSANPAAPLPAPTADETAVANSINAFSQNLYAQLQQQQGPQNLVFSPFSIETALAMTYAGAEGETASQMASALDFTLDPNDVESGFGSLLSALNAEGQSGNFTLNAADALWLQQGFPLQSEFLNLMQADFAGGVNQVDYENAAEAARVTINNWVSQQTNGKIQNLIPEGQLDQFTRLVLTNAVYFKGEWASAFDPSQTSNDSFTLSSGNQDSVPTMHQTGNFGYMESDGYQVLDMPYQGNQLSMDFLLPTSDATLNTLPANLGDWLQGLSSQLVDISLPKFQINTSFSLNNTLQAMGMTDAFSPSADFTGIHTPTSPADNLYISNVDHQAYIDVDETGTEAAAATSIGMMTASVAVGQPVPIVFDADHPFEFVIRDDQSGAILFQGQVTNPDPNATQTPPAPGSEVPTLPGPIQFASSGTASNPGDTSPVTPPVAAPVGTTPITPAPAPQPAPPLPPPAIPAGTGPELDPNFGQGGVVDTPCPPVDPNVSYYLSMFGGMPILGSVVQPDGKTLVAGGVVGLGGTTDTTLERFNSDGSLDTTFGVNGTESDVLSTANFRVQSMALEPDGQIVLGGYVQNYAGSIGALAMLNSDGSLDQSFETRGLLLPPAPTTSSSPADWNLTGIDSLVVTSDGKIIFSGPASGTMPPTPTSMAYVMVTGQVMAEVDGNGVLDANFLGSEFPASFGNVTLGLAPNGQIVVLSNGQVEEFNADGTPDTQFGNAGIVTLAANGSQSTMVVQPDGKIIVSLLGMESAPFQFDVVRLNTDGSLDTSFNFTTQLYVSPGTPEAVTMNLNPAGQIIMTGESLDGLGSGLVSLARFNSDGSFDSSFPLGMIELTNVIAESNGEVVTVGYPVVADGPDFSDFIDITGDWELEKAYWPATVAPTSPVDQPPGRTVVVVVTPPGAGSGPTPGNSNTGPSTDSNSLDISLLFVTNVTTNTTAAASPTTAIVGASPPTAAPASSSNTVTSSPQQQSASAPSTPTSLTDDSDADDEAGPSDASPTLASVDGLFTTLGA